MNLKIKQNMNLTYDPSVKSFECNCRILLKRAALSEGKKNCYRLSLHHLDTDLICSGGRSLSLPI